MGFLGGRMVVTIKDALDVFIHRDAASSFDVIPLEIDASKFGAFPIFRDGVVWLEDIAQVVDMDITNILYT